jgi:AcrR family transcriptional regulator
VVRYTEDSVRLSVKDTRERDAGLDELVIRPAERIAREQRSDAAYNRDALVRAATAAVHREGIRVRMSTIAEDAGVGVGTLYRHFATREELLNHLTHRSFEMVLANARAAEDITSTGSDALRQFVEAAIALRDQLVLPLHGGPPVTDRATIVVRDQVHRTIQRLIDRGRRDGTIKTDVSPRDIVALGAMLAQPRPNGSGWNATCKRILSTYLNGLQATGTAEAQSPKEPAKKA